MPNHLYRFDPDTGAVHVAATDFDNPNGIAFTKDGRTAYVYAFNVDLQTHQFTNRRVLAYIDAGTPDEIQIDTQGNVFVSCADGVQVLYLGLCSGRDTSWEDLHRNAICEWVFASLDQVVVLSETKVFLVNIAARGVV